MKVCAYKKSTSLHQYMYALHKHIHAGGYRRTKTDSFMILILKVGYVTLVQTCTHTYKCNKYKKKTCRIRDGRAKTNTYMYKGSRDNYGQGAPYTNIFVTQFL